jgi:hypothetical protein
MSAWPQYSVSQVSLSSHHPYYVLYNSVCLEYQHQGMDLQQYTPSRVCLTINIHIYYVCIFAMETKTLLWTMDYVSPSATVTVFSDLAVLYSSRNTWLHPMIHRIFEPLVTSHVNPVHLALQGMVASASTNPTACKWR